MKKIIVNQVGYLTNGFKRAVVAEKLEACEFELKSGDKTVYTGKLEFKGFDKESGDEVTIADFSEFEVPGKYQIFIDGLEPVIVDIDDKVYDKTFHDINKAFYYLRCGCELEEEHAGKFIHKPCHCKKAVLWENHSVEREVTGGWHDAGDYGRYVTAGACALSHLLYAWKFYPKAFLNTNISLPQDYDMPDILRECRYELEWFLKMQREDGAVYHKATTAYHAPFVMPEDDQAQMFVLPVSSMATADFAAIGALAYGIYMPYDKEFADKLLNAAKKTGEWLIANRDFIGFKNPEGCRTGEYGEWNDRDNRFWAFSELYAATGDNKYLDELMEYYKCDFPKSHLGYGSVGGFGAMACLFHERKVDSLKTELEKAFLDEAEKLAKQAEESGYGVAMIEEDYHWGSNMTVLKQGMIFAIANRILGSDRYSKYMQVHWDYVLGLNALDFSYVSGSGERSLAHPHLRPAQADGIDECIPGMISGGPNRNPCVYEEKKNIPQGTPPMKSYADVWEGFSVNEITIYWNSPGVFLGAALLA